MANNALYSNQFLHLGKGDPNSPKTAIYSIESPSIKSENQGLHSSSCVGCTSAPIVVGCFFPLLCQVQEFGNLYANTLAAIAI